jgi:hypothetical protein
VNHTGLRLASTARTISGGVREGDSEEENLDRRSPAARDAVGPSLSARLRPVVQSRVNHTGLRLASTARTISGGVREGDSEEENLDRRSPAERDAVGPTLSARLRPVVQSRVNHTGLRLASTARTISGGVREGDSEEENLDRRSPAARDAVGPSLSARAMKVK